MSALAHRPAAFMKKPVAIENVLFFLMVSSIALFSLGCWLSSVNSAFAMAIFAGLMGASFRDGRESMEFFSEPPYNAEAESEAERHELESFTSAPKSKARRRRL